MVSDQHHGYVNLQWHPTMSIRIGGTSYLFIHAIRKFLCWLHEPAALNGKQILLHLQHQSETWETAQNQIEKSCKYDTANDWNETAKTTAALKTETKCIRKVHRIGTYLQRLLKAKRDWKQGASLVATSRHPSNRADKSVQKLGTNTLGATEAARSDIHSSQRCTTQSF